MSEFISDLLGDLNEAQQEAVRHSKGPLLVVAGPGTGKTRTLTRRIAFLIRERQVNPASLAAITFTNRAAAEMRERLQDLLPDQAQAIGFVGTFHALGLDIVRREARQLGFDQGPVLYGEEDQKALYRELLQALKPKKGRGAVEKVMAAIESCLNRHLPVAGEVEGYDIDAVYKAYTQHKQEEGAVDFNDLILLPMELFTRDAKIVAQYREKFRHLFVDEYQDVNWLQVQLTRWLGEGADSLMAIGDPDQAIYSFRGSDVKNFLNFPDTFPEARVLQLSNNYRSSMTILRASDQVICNNQVRLGTAKPAKAVGEQGLRLDQRELASDKAEAVFVSRTIEQLAGGIGRYGLVSGSLDHHFDAGAADEDREYGFGDIAVLYRLNAQARLIRDALDTSAIPYQQIGGKEQGADPHERFVLAAARLTVSPKNRAAWRIMEQFRDKRKKGGAETGTAFDPEQAAQSCADAMDGIEEAARARLGSIDRIQQAARAQAGTFESVPDNDLFLHVAGTFAKALPSEAEALLRAAENLNDQVRIAKADLRDFLAGAPLALREDPYEARCEKVTLSTIHASKGLEYPVVFIVGLEEGIMPYIREDEAFPPAALEEERRLLYVGMTRARS